MDASLIYLSKLPIETLESKLQTDASEGQVRFEHLRTTTLRAIDKMEAISNGLTEKIKTYLDANVIETLRERQRILWAEQARLKAELEKVEETLGCWQQRVCDLTQVVRDKGKTLADVRRQAEKEATQVKTPADQVGQVLALIVHDQLRRR